MSVSAPHLNCMVVCGWCVCVRACVVCFLFLEGGRAEETKSMCLDTFALSVLLHYSTFFALRLLFSLLFNVHM